MMDRLLKVFNSASEALRSTVELTSLYTCWPWMQKDLPNGDGKPVLVLPGLLTNDLYNSPLHQCLRGKGYKVYGWDGGINLGLNEKTARHLQERLKEVFEENGGRKVAIVGHSLGGIFGRELARDFPEMVESVITLGTPFGMTEQDAPPMLNHLYAMINPDGDPQELTDKDLQNRRLTPPPVPTTSIYSFGDGVVPWRACINPATPLAENISVDSSHLGMIYHPLAVTAVLDRLAQDPADWKPFNAKKYSAFYAATPAQDVPANPAWKASGASRQIFKKK